MKEKGTVMRELKKAMVQANKHYQLIEQDDKIAIGFSGGVDSFALVAGLDQFRRSSPFSFEFDVFHMNMGFDDMDIHQAASWCDNLGYPLTMIETNIVNVLKQHPQKNNEYSCSICSRLKKGTIVKYAKEHGYNKVAFAHHADDAIETLFLNMVYGAKIATFTPKMFLSNQEITFIRPLVYTFKNQIENYALQYKWPVVASTCPNNFNTQRDEMRKIIQQIINHYPLAKSNLLKMIYNEKQVDLWQPFVEKTRKYEKNNENT